MSENQKEESNSSGNLDDSIARKAKFESKIRPDIGNLGIYNSDASTSASFQGVTGPTGESDAPLVIEKGADQKINVEADASSSYSPSPEIPSESSESEEILYEDENVGTTPEGDDSLHSERTIIDKTGKFLKFILPENPNSENDKAGFYNIAESIGDIIRNPVLKPPFNICVTGDYGSGKSKILKQLIENLQGQNNKIVEFDIGRYHNSDHIWEALIFQFFKAFPNNLSSLFSYYRKSEWSFSKIFNSLILLLSIALSVLAWFWAIADIGKKIEYVHLYLIPLLPTAFFLMNVYKIWTHPLVSKALNNSFHISKSNFISRLNYRLNLENILKRIFNIWLNNEDKVILIIDNLDRCNPKNVAEIIDELFALMSTPGVMERLISIIAVDELSLIKAIDDRVNVNKEEYFEKLFALKIKVPHLNEALCKQFLSEKIGLLIPNDSTSEADKTRSYSDTDINDEEKIEISRQLSIALYKYHYNFTPRRILRIIFAYQFSKYLWARWTQGRPNDNFIVNGIIHEIVLRFANHNYHIGGPKRSESSYFLDLVCPKYQIAEVLKSPEQL